MLHRLALTLALLAVLALPSAALAGPVARSSATCSDYSNQADAQRAKDTRDADGDGIYCESLPCPCARPGAGSGDDAAARRRRARARARARARRRARLRRDRARRRRIDRTPGRIVDVIDGDTVKVKLGGSVNKTYTVRLLGIDTPESRKPGVPVECGAKEATSSMFNLGFTAAQDTDGDKLLDRKGGTGVRVDVTTDRSQRVKDRFGRLLVYVDVPSEARGPGIARYDLSQTQIGAGWSKTYTFKKRVRRYNRYRSAEGAARLAGRGVWGECGGDFHSQQ